MMQSIRTTAAWLRMVLAVLFTAAAVIQIPAMAIAHSTASIQQAAADRDVHEHGSHATHGHHHPDGPHQADGHHQSDFPAAADITHDQPNCCTVGCCLAVNPISASAPATMHRLIGLLDHAPARMMLPAAPDPTDPPPRLPL